MTEEFIDFNLGTRWRGMFFKEEEGMVSIVNGNETGNDRTRETEDYPQSRRTVQPEVSPKVYRWKVRRLKTRQWCKNELSSMVSGPNE